MKLAKKSKWNWKKRYFMLTPYHIAYYENDKPNQKIKGEIRITADSQVTSDINDKKNGFHFIFSNEWESLTLSTTSEADRSQWILTIKSTIKHAEDSLMTYAILLHPQPKVNPRSSGKITDLVTRKYFILANNLLTFHPDEQKTSEIEGLVNINDHTVLDEIDDDQRIISLIDSDPARTKVTFQFKAMNVGYESTSAQYQRWKTAIIALTKPRYTQPATEVVPVQPSAKSGTRRRSKQIEQSPVPPLPQEEDEEEVELPPLPAEEPPDSPVPPPPETPATPTSTRSALRKVGFAMVEPEEVEETVAPEEEPEPLRLSLSVSPSPRKSTRGFDFNDDDENSVSGSANSGNFDDLRKEVDPSEQSPNAIRRSLQRRQSRSLSPATTPRGSTAGSPKAGARGSISSKGGRSSSADLLRRSSSNLLVDFGLFRTPNTAVLDLPEAPSAAAEIFRTVSKLPLTKLLFDHYSKESTYLDLNAIQHLSYEVGVYYSFMEVKISVKPYTSGSTQMNFENFAKWWQYNPDFK